MESAGGTLGNKLKRASWEMDQTTLTETYNGLTPLEIKLKRSPIRPPYNI